MTTKPDIKETVTADVRRHFVSRLESLADDKIYRLEKLYEKITGEQAGVDYSDEHFVGDDDVISCSTLVALVKEGKITKDDVDFTKILNGLKRAKDDSYLAESDAVYLFKPNIRRLAKTRQKKIYAERKKLDRKLNKTTEQIRREVEKIRDQVYFGKGANTLRKLLQNFADKKFTM